MKQILLIPKPKYRARKTVRAISTREYNHVIFKARMPVLRRHHRMIKTVVGDWQLKFGIRLKGVAIMEDHIHMAVKTPSRLALQNFMRVVAGVIALKIGRGKLWKQRVWSRIVRVGRDLRRVLEYIFNNPLKAGVVSEVDLYRISHGVLHPT